MEAIGQREAAPDGDLLLPGVMLVAALAWIGGHFSGYATGVPAQLLVVLVHVVLVAVAAVGLLACLDASRPAVGPRLLLGVAICVKAITVVAIVCALTHVVGFGPRGFLDWMPIGTANAGGGLILLAHIRRRRRPLR